MRERRRQIEGNSPPLFDVAIVCEIGGRATMEDTYHFADLHGDGSEVFGGVYDGHGGAFAAEYVRAHLHTAFFQELDSGKTVEEAFKIAYEGISGQLREQKSGTTAVNFYLKDGILYHANAGDGRLIVVGHAGVHQLSRDHRVDDPEERRRIVEQGGEIAWPYVLKGGQGLMPTRTIGDEYFKDVGVTATPSVGRYQLRPEDTWIVVGTDGLFDIMRNEEIASLLERYQAALAASQAIKEEVLINRVGDDNLTFLLMKRRANAPTAKNERDHS